MTALSNFSRRVATRRPTMADVALRAGVALKTVSRVVNRESGVRASTRERVGTAIQELGYLPDLSARRLAAGRSHLLGMTFPVGRDGLERAVELQRGVLERAAAEGYGVLLESASASPGAASRPVLAQAGADGLILCEAGEDRALLEWLVALARPYVAVNPRARSPEVPYAASASRQGAHDMTEHLLSLGHRRIAFLAAAGAPDTPERSAGHRDVLVTHGQGPGVAPVRRVDPPLFGGARAATHRLLARRRPPTAIFASEPALAMGALAAAHAAGVSVPERLSVAVFGDPPSAREAWPPLSAVREPLADLGWAAADFLLRRLGGAPVEPLALELPTQLALRASTAPPRS